MNYKYYILENKNKGVDGVISDDNGEIKYHALTIIAVENKFSRTEEPHLLPYYESHIRTMNAQILVDNFDEITITKDYWEAFYHAGGNRRKAVAESSEIA